MAAHPLPLGRLSALRGGISCRSPYGVQSTYAVFEPVALANLAVHEVGFVPDAVGVPVEFDGKLAVRSMFWPPVLKPPPPTAC